MLMIERTLITESDKLSAEQNKGNFQSAELKSVSYASMPVVLKGRAEGGYNLSLRVTGRTPDDTGFDFFKPNATSGIPLSQASTFGLTSLMLNGTTFREVSLSSTSYGLGVGGTTSTRTTITTYTYEFPQLPDAYWEYLMDELYTGMVKLFKDKYQIGFVPVENVTGTTQYKTLFSTQDTNTKDVVRKSYKNTLRADPQSLSEILGKVSSNNTSNVPVINMMKEANVDGLVSVKLVLTVGGNKDGKVVLSPLLRISIVGRDEKNNSKQGTYVVGLLRGPGVPFNSDAVKNDKKAFVNACSLPQLLNGLDQALRTLKMKEGELGYDAIWSIGK